jgi:hypothetical protein
MVTKDLAKQMLEHNNKHCGFMSNEFNELSIFSHHPKTADYGLFHATEEKLVLINNDSGERVFLSKLADSIWLPIIRSMADGVSTVTINELFKLLKSRNDYKKISDIPDDVLKHYGQHEAPIVVVHDDQHIAGFVVTDILVVDELNSILVAEVTITRASLEVDLDNDQVEEFSIPAFSGTVNIPIPVPNDLIPQNQSFTKNTINIGEFSFTLNPASHIANLRRLGVITL